MDRRILAVAALAALVIAAGGCFNPFSPRIAPTAGVYVPPPSPSTPAGVVRLLEWCWDNRSITQYREVFTDDYQFIFGLRDSAGNPTRDPPLTREEELTTASNLFVGGAAQPVATSITLNLDPTLNAQPDSRPGMDPRTHKEILTNVDLSIKVEGGKEYRISGYARYFVVRGDVALIPKELKDRGFLPDSSRWYIQRWNDETLGSSPNAVQPAAGLAGVRPVPRTAPAGVLGDAIVLTWNELRAMYRSRY